MTMNSTHWIGGLLAALAAAPAFGLSPSEVFEKVASSVWAVRGVDAEERPITHGSGVVIEPGRMVTACHVLAKAKAIQVRRGGRAYGASLEHADAERDLCLLRIEEFTAPAASVAPSSEVKIGQRAYAVGNAERLGLTLSDGLVSGLQSEDPKLPPIQTTAALPQGSSGGGLFDEHGRLIGITTLNVARTGLAQGLNFAVPSAWIAEVPQRAKAQLAAHDAAKAAAAAATPRPDVSPQMAGADEGWTYRLTGRDLQAGSHEVILLSHAGDEIVEQTFTADGSPQRTLHRKGAYILPVGELSLFSPYFATFAKLTPGARIPGIDNLDHRTCGPGWTCSVEARVMGNERLQLPAGEFETIRVRIDQAWVGLSQTMDRGETGGRTLYVWYSPQIKRAVKFSSRGRLSRYIETQFDLELIAYKVKSK